MFPIDHEYVPVRLRVGPNDGQGMDLHLDMLDRPYLEHGCK